jgi:hypothetical protein
MTIRRNDPDRLSNHFERDALLVQLGTALEAERESQGERASRRVPSSTRAWRDGIRGSGHSSPRPARSDVGW